MSTPSWIRIPSGGRHPHPTHLQLRKEREETYTLPVTANSREFDNIEGPEKRPITPTDISRLFNYSDSSDTGSAASSRGESPIDKDRVIFMRAQRKSERSAERRGVRSGGGVSNVRGRPKTPSTPVTPMFPFVPSARTKPPSPKRDSSPSGVTTCVPVNQIYPVWSPQSPPPGKANAILGIGYPPIVSPRLSRRDVSTLMAARFKDPVLDGWDVSDSDSTKSPVKPLALKLWGLLALGWKKTPTPRVASNKTVDRSRLGKSYNPASFGVTEYPVVSSALPVEEKGVSNIIPTEFTSDGFSPTSPRQTLHPSWNTSDKNPHTSPNTTRKAELNTLAPMGKPASPQAVSSRGKYNLIDGTSRRSLDDPSPSPMSVWPNSRWSDYSEADSVKESWRSSVLNRFHLPRVTGVRWKLDLRAPVAAAKEWIRNVGVKGVADVKEVEEVAAMGKWSGETGAGIFNHTFASVAAAVGHRGNMSSGSGLFSARGEVVVCRSDRIVTLSKNILHPDSRAEKGSISCISTPKNTPNLTRTRPVSTRTAAVVMLPAGTPSSNGGEKVASPSRKFKDALEKYMMKDSKKKEEKRRMEMKKKTTDLCA